MAARRWLGAGLLAMAALMVAWWWMRAGEGAGDRPAPPAPVAVQPPVPGATAVAPGPSARRGTLPGIVPPSIESATPAEVAAMRDAEVERSAASAPVASYKGSDGRQHAFDYATTPADDAAEREADARREQVLAQMRADPANFAARNGLRPREVELMMDGSLAIPERLLH